MEKIDVYDGDTKFEWGTIWIKNPIHRKGQDPYRFKATNKKDVEVISKHHNNYLIEELNLFPNQYIKPIFDKDSYDVPIDSAKDMEMIRKIFKDAVIKEARRPPRMKNGKMFHSARYYVQNERIRANQLEDLIRFQGDIPNDYFDLSKYGKGGQFFTIYNTKKFDGDVPQLVPYNDPNPNIFDYYATYVLKKYKDWDNEWEQLQIFLAYKKEHEAKVVYKEDDEEVIQEEPTELNEIIKRLSPKRADWFADWFKVVFAIINYGVRIDLHTRTIEGLIHQFSKKSICFYEEDKVDKWIADNYTRISESNTKQKLGRNFLINVCLKEDDFKYWSEKYKYRDYNSVLKQFNHECIRVLGNTKWIKMCVVDDVNLVPYILMTKEEVIHRYSIEGRYFYMKKVINDDKEDVSEYSIVDAKSPFWKDPNVKRYENIIYAPLRPIDDKYYNTWSGWKASTYKFCLDYSKCDVFINHLKGAWCKNDEKLTKWFLEYFSGILRGARTCVCPIVRGKQGSGKDCFISELFMNRIMGSDYCITTNNPVAHIFGKFNGALLNKSFVVIEEGGYDLEKEYEQLKSIITNDKLTIEKKFENVVNAKNYVNAIVSTNKHDILKGDRGMKQRRLIYIECDPVKRSTEYYDQYFKALEDEEALSAFYNYLLDKDKVYQYDINDLAYLQKTMPDTKIGLDIAYRNLPLTTKFLKDDYFSFEVLEDWITTKPQKAMQISGKDLQTSYKSYCEYNGLEKVKMEQFTTNLLNNNDIEYKRLTGGMRYVIPFESIVSLHQLMKKDKDDGKVFENDALVYKKITYNFDEDE